MARQPRARKPGYVYCYQFDAESCFKVGRTIRDPEQRKKAYQAGAPGKLNPFVGQFGQILREAENLRRTIPRDTLAEPSSEMFDLYRQLRAETRESFFLQRRIEVLQAKIQVAIGGNCGMKGIASWGWWPRFTIDLENFKADHPDLFEKYKRDSSSRKFLPERLDLSKL